MKKRLVVSLAVTCLFVLAAALTIYAAGTAEDPLISLSYLNSVVLPQLEQKVDARVQTAMASELGDAVVEAVEQQMGSLVQGGSVTVSGGATLEALQLLEGQTLSAAGEGSLEVLLRRGMFHTVDPENGGITNMTTGHEILGVADLTLQNLYLLPRGDARGIVCDTQEGWVMVRGSYTVTGGIHAQPVQETPGTPEEPMPQPQTTAPTNPTVSTHAADSSLPATEPTMDT